MQYSYFSVTSGFPHKTVQPFEIFLLFSHKVEIGKNFWIYASKVVCGVRGGVGPV